MRPIDAIVGYLIRCGETLDHAAAGSLPRCHASQDGFDLEAGVRVRADERDRLERLCRYVLRPPLAGERLRFLDNGDVLLALERRWSDVTTHLRFSPVEWLERLAVLTLRPAQGLCLGVRGRGWSSRRGPITPVRSTTGAPPPLMLPIVRERS